MITTSSVTFLVSLGARGRRCGLVLAALLAGAAAALRADVPISGPATAGFEAYDRTIPALLTKWQVPGGALAVAYRGRIVFARGYGYADREAVRPVQPDTTFRVMSISKIFTASLIMKLVEDGQLSLDDHPFELLNYPTPTYAGAKRDARLVDIRVRHLLNHSAGWLSNSASNPFIGGRGFAPILYQRQIAQLMGRASPADAETILRYVVGQPLQASPGTAYGYCNHGYLLLGRLIELKTGLPYEQAMQQFLSAASISGVALGGSRRAELAADEAAYYDDPGAGLVDSHFGTGKVPAPYAYSLPGWDAAGGWKMSAIECLRFLLALEGLNGTPRLLQPDTVALMREPQASSSYYGYGWFARYACSSGDDQGHGGGSWGTKTWALRSADGDWHTVLLLNSLPTEALNGGAQFESDAYAALHTLPAGFAPTAAADLTWSTLGWDGWWRHYFGDSVWPAVVDVDRDGFSELIEYSAGLDPTKAQPERPAVEVLLAADGSATLTYRRVILEHALVWRVQTSDDGRTWTNVAAAPSSTALNADGTWSVTVSLPQAAKARLWVQRLANAAEATKEFDLLALGLPSITGHPASRTLAAGGSVTLAVTASAPTGATLTYQWQRDGQPVAGATLPTLTLAAVTAADAGDYTAVVSAAGRTVTSRLARLTVASPDPGRLVNLSVRGTAGIDGQPLIVGFVVSGGGAKPLLLRALGPSLTRLGVDSGAMTDPRLTLHEGSGSADHVAASNDDWSARSGDEATLRAVFAELGAVAFDSGSRDAALVVPVAGLRTMHVSGASAGARGVVLAEAYDAGATSSPRLINVSARNHVDAAPEVLIAGFVINGNVPKRVLVRGVGPGLLEQGVTGVLADPRLELHARYQERDVVFATNDNWAEEPGVAEAGQQVGAFTLQAGSRDAALLVTLPPGVYSALVAGVADGTGEALVEVYEVE